MGQHIEAYLPTPLLSSSAYCFSFLIVLMEGGTLTPDIDAQCTATVLRETPSRTQGRGPRPERPLQIQLVLCIMYRFNIACFIPFRLQ